MQITRGRKIQVFFKIQEKRTARVRKKVHIARKFGSDLWKLVRIVERHRDRAKNLKSK